MAKPHIMIVEDEAITGKLLEITLENMGYAVTSVEKTGEQAVEKAKQNRPDIILMDIHLKGKMDGIEAAELIRSRFDIPSIFLTAYSDDKSLERAKLVTPFGYILKPFQKKELKITIEMGLYALKINRKRIEAENALQKAHDDLEARVKERTAELVSSNALLKHEIEIRRQVEERLLASEKKFSKIFHMNPVGIIISTTREGKIIDANESAVEVTGYSYHESIGRTAVDIGFWKTQDERDRMMQRLKEKGNFRDIETVFENRSGQKRLGLLSQEQIDIDGVSCIITTLQDITERKMAEKAVMHSKQILESVFDAILEPLIMVDKNMKILKLNKAALAYYGVEFKDAINSSCYEVLKDQYTPCRGCRLSPAVSNSRAITFERKGCINPERYEQISTYPVMESSVEIGTIVRISDITEKKNSQALLARADRLSSLGQLSGGIAHEIRNPLGGIKLFLDILSDEDRYKRSEEEREIFDDIDMNINKINGIIKRVLAFAKPGGTYSDNVDINEVIKETLQLFTNQLRKSNINPELSLDKSISHTKGDFIALQQVITNLVLNAIQAMDRGGSLTIKTFKGESSLYKGRRTIGIDIKDTGIGIKQEEQANIFNPFFTTKPTGTGLGLAISHHIMQQHGGTLLFKSRPGKGSTFSIELPDVKER